jgi:hypothetical protein
LRSGDINSASWDAAAELRLVRLANLAAKWGGVSVTGMAQAWIPQALGVSIVTITTALLLSS